MSYLPCTAMHGMCRLRCQPVRQDDNIIKISSHLVNSLLLEKLAIVEPSLYSVRQLRQRCNLDHMITTYIVQEVVILYLGKCALDEYSMNAVSKRGSITDGYLHGQLVEVLYLRNLGRIDIQHGGEHPAPSNISS